MSKIRVAVFDDESFFRESVALLLEGRVDMELAGSYIDANNLIQDLSDSEPDIVLMDLELPGIDGIEAVKIIRKNFPPLPVIMITQHEEEDYVIHAIEAGANGYVLKTAPADKIIQNIKDILNSSPVPSLMAQQILEMFSESFSMRAGSFSNNLDKHEKRILSELIDGKSYKRIAKEMKIDYSELKSQVKTIYKKLDVTSVAGAVAIAVKHNIAHHSDT